MTIITRVETETKSIWVNLEQFLQQREAEWQSEEEPAPFASYEGDLHEQLMRLEQELLGAEMKRYDVDVKEIEVEGRRYQRVMSSGKNYLSTAGEVRVERQLYRRAGASEERCICPMELRLGVIDGYATPAAGRQMSFVASHLPARTAADFFVEMGGMTPSHTTIDKQPKLVSQPWEAARQQWEQTVREQESVPAAAMVMAVSLDGVMAPINQADGSKKTASPTKQASGPLGYREIGCGSVALYDQEGQRLQTVRYGRMPERKKVTLRQQLTAECQHILQQAPHLKVVKLADGARDNWDFLSNLDLGVSSTAQANVEQIEIVDFCHAADHLKRGCDAIWPHDADKSQAKFDRLRTLLKEADGGANKVIGSFRYYVGRLSGKAKQSLQTELTYFCNQCPRMDYASYLKQGLPIASGVIEATCKTLVTQRMKCSGMRWGISGGQAVLTLRSLVQSGRWQHAWQLIQPAFCKPVSIVKVPAVQIDHQDTTSVSEVIMRVPYLADSTKDYASLPLAA